jgi:hypothetical protein
MKMYRRIGAVVVAAAAAVGMASIGTATAASAAPKGPQPVNSRLHAVKANTGTWVNVAWRTDRKICDAKVRFSAARVGIDYASRRDFATFSRGNSLKAGRTDYTAVEVTPHFDRAGVAMLRATIEFTNCAPRDRTQRYTTTLTLPVLRSGNGHTTGGGHTTTGGGGHTTTGGGHTTTGGGGHTTTGGGHTTTGGGHTTGGEHPVH